MTFGEKLRNARKEAGFSQEQLAEKLSVSRSAVAKWETDNGMPDVGNLKAIATLLNVSIDYLLDKDEKITFNEIREPIEIESFEKTGKCRDRKDAAAYWKYKDADAIYPLIRRKKLNAGEFMLDLVTSWGVSQLADYASNTDGYYLVEKAGRQLLVRVSDDFITTSELAGRVDPGKFVIGNNIFRKTTYRLI
ncbi:MAG: helix-turn-helix transcriptional regulator [Erysipelotrichaceae bacterium]|nr:helix-turn-helix transcriptional regulator [Erysipelotrichaceae bacterium]